MPWQLNIRAIASGVALVIAFGFGWAVNGWRFESKIAELKNAALDEKLAAEVASRRKESALRADADKIRGEYERKISSLNGRLDAALAGMFDRASRNQAGTDTGNHQTAGSCDGRQLFREDGEFLIREAARADTIRQAYQSCVEQYDSVKLKMEQQNGR